MIQHRILLGLTNNDCHFIGWQEAHRPSHALCETLYPLKSRSAPNYSPTLANISSPSPWTQKLKFGSLGMYRLYFDHVHTCGNSGVIKIFDKIYVLMCACQFNTINIYTLYKYSLVLTGWHKLLKASCCYRCPLSSDIY